MADKGLKEEETGSSLEKERERAEIKRVDREPMKPGEIFCLIDASWLRQWKAFVRYDPSPLSKQPSLKPGPIDNTGLVDHIKDRTNTLPSSPTVPSLKPRLYLGHELFAIPQEMWNLLFEW